MDMAVLNVIFLKRKNTLKPQGNEHAAGNLSFHVHLQTTTTYHIVSSAKLHQSCFCSQKERVILLLPSMLTSTLKMCNSVWNKSKYHLFLLVSFSFKHLIVVFLSSYRYVIPLDVQVAHYTPAIFPLVPMISSKINQLCCDSWKIIVANKEMTDSGTLGVTAMRIRNPTTLSLFFPYPLTPLASPGLELNGITLFYNDFYERLDVMDENKKVCTTVML